MTTDVVHVKLAIADPEKFVLMDAAILKLVELDSATHTISMFGGRYIATGPGGIANLSTIQLTATMPLDTFETYRTMFKKYADSYEVPVPGDIVFTELVAEHLPQPSMHVLRQGDTWCFGEHGASYSIEVGVDMVVMLDTNRQCTVTDLQGDVIDTKKLIDISLTNKC